jgi:hypothetical protein
MGEDSDSDERLCTVCWRPVWCHTASPFVARACISIAMHGARASRDEYHPREYDTRPDIDDDSPSDNYI